MLALAMVSDDGIVSRLHNWARYCRINPDRPDDSCQNPFWQQMGEDQREGADEVDKDAIVIPADILDKIAKLRGDRDPIDEYDAANLDGWIRQLKGPKDVEPEDTHRAVLVRRFVLRQKLGHQYLDAALDALEALMAANREVVGEMRRRGMR